LNPPLPWAVTFAGIRFDAEETGLGQQALTELLDNVPVALAVSMGPEQRYVFANRVARRFLETRAADPIGRTVSEVMRELFSPAVQEKRQRVLDTGEPEDLPGLAMPMGEGQEPSFWDLKLLPVRDAEGRPVGILTIGVDVTAELQARAEAENQTRATQYHAQRLGLAIEATELGLWEWDAQSGRVFWSERQKEIFGLPPDAAVTFESWREALHPEDRDAVLEAVGRVNDPGSGGRLRLEHRILRPSGEVRWLQASGQMIYESGEGPKKPLRLLGTVIDITDRKRAEEDRQVLVRELNHRVKNLFAVASGMVSLTARSATSPQEMGKALRGRLETLGRAHSLIAPALSGGGVENRSAAMNELVRAVLAPYEETGRITAEGEALKVGPNATTALTLVLHELATNALKYGALSTEAGRLAIAWRLDGGSLVLTWAESGGPAVEGAPATEGFGSQLARKSITGQLGGRIHFDWRREGLNLTMTLPVDRLER
jgi:PAS domain S-box-containing protein